MNGTEDKIIARGLLPPGPLLIVKKHLPAVKGKILRIIVSNPESADELVEYFQSRGATTETDQAGDDFHVIADLTRFKDSD